MITYSSRFKIQAKKRKFKFQKFKIHFRVNESVQDPLSKMSMTREELINYLKGNPPQMTTVKKDIDPYTVEIRYGKYRGKTIGDLINGNKVEEIQYLNWMKTNTKSEFMKDVITKATNKKLASLGIEPNPQLTKA